jgi:hypothetical protein
LSSYLLGGAPGERHRAICKADRKGCDTHGTKLMPDADADENRPGDPQGDTRPPRTNRACDHDQEPGPTTPETNPTEQSRVAHITVRYRRQQQASRRVLTHELVA